MEQNFNPGLALIGLSGTRPWVLKMTEGLDLGAVPTSVISSPRVGESGFRNLEYSSRNPGIPLRTGSESRIQAPLKKTRSQPQESGIHGMGSRIQDCLGFHYMGRNFLSRNKYLYLPPPPPPPAPRDLRQPLVNKTPRKIFGYKSLSRKWPASETYSPFSLLPNSVLLRLLRLNRISFCFKFTRLCNLNDRQLSD